MITSRMKSTKIAAVDVNSPPPQPTPPTTSLMCATSLYLKYTPSYSNSDKQFGHIYLFYSLIIKILVSCQSHFYGFHFYFFWIAHSSCQSKNTSKVISISYDMVWFSWRCFDLFHLMGSVPIKASRLFKYRCFSDCATVFPQTLLHLSFWYYSRFITI